jgi:hypothetical protein
VRERAAAVVHFERSSLTSAALIANCVGDRVPARARGRVHSVFARACNIEMQGGGLVTLLANGLGAAPQGIRLDAPVARFDTWLRAGHGAILDNAVLWLQDAGVAVDLSAAARWRGTVAAVCTEPCANATRAALHEVHATIYEHAPPQGIAPALADPAGSVSSLQRALALRLAEVLPRLARATEWRDVPAIASAAARLVGLGPGLTPAGDDFLTGYLAALWSRAGYDGRLRAMLPALARAFAQLTARTHPISRQMLDDATQGHFPQCLVDVTIAVSGAGNVVESIAQACATGHSSGADTLCGLLFGYAPELLRMPPTDLRAWRTFRFNADCVAAA